MPWKWEGAIISKVAAIYYLRGPVYNKKLEDMQRSKKA